MSAFPWPEAMRFGLGVLRLAPVDFWAMTPRELAAAMSAFSANPSALCRKDLKTMMALFPDPETAMKKDEPNARQTRSRRTRP